MADGRLHVDNIDVFCEVGVYNVEQTRRILEAGMRLGLAANFHGEELHCLHSAEVKSDVYGNHLLDDAAMLPVRS